ncbi:MAG TPA: uracil-xanthine permease family protein [Methanocorpusculum sp.]|nr:uracil-xanthine permease family protein [Methanocorpusculum sp.]HJJ39879.1 uracil-xanthine permease family protein [Methanocorpusculum sp.]HJJ49168.1 uracil-xanthine permease family protein [Methanocorpusculum sp.]HJJ56826.1 uracil-xanthine permease family protein [Methanocorpusculum sp.]
MENSQSNSAKKGGKLAVLGIQHVFAMFGSTILVPILTGLPVSVALFCAGVGTLIFHLFTKGKVPVFLGSSFAFIAAIGVVSANEGLEYATGGIVAAGCVYLVLAVLVFFVGSERIRKLFPPVVTGPVIMIIGLMLASTAIGYFSDGWSYLVGVVVIATVIIVSLLVKGFLRMLPILFGLIAGYLLCMLLTGCGIDVGLDYSVITGASLFSVPAFFLPKFSFSACLMIAPIAIVTFIEHLGDISANGEVVGKDFFKDPGLHRTLLGDGLASIFAGAVGGPSNTTYSENTGVLAATRNYNPRTLEIAAIVAIVISFIGYLTGFISSIPSAVLGGMCIVLFGMIAAVGMRNLVENHVDFKNQRNVLIVGIMLIIAIGGLAIPIIPDANLSLSGVALSAVVGIILNLILPERLGKLPDDKKEEQ